MFSIPGGGSQPTGFQPTGNPLIMKPTFGSVGAQFVRFFVHKVYNGGKSEKEDLEIKDHIQICEITNDRFTKCPIRIKDMSQQQRVVLNPLYQRFLSQQDSTDTDILDWEACTENERILLGQMGIHSVEQLSSYSDTDLYKLGPQGAELRERAKRHARSKEVKKSAEDSEEMAYLRKRLEDMEKQLTEKQENYFASQVAKVQTEAISQTIPQNPFQHEAKPRPGRPRKQIMTDAPA